MFTFICLLFLLINLLSCHNRLKNPSTKECLSFHTIKRYHISLYNMVKVRGQGSGGRHLLPTVKNRKPESSSDRGVLTIWYSLVSIELHN